MKYCFVFVLFVLALIFRLKALNQSANVNVGKIDKTGKSQFAWALHLYNEYRSYECLLRQSTFVIFTHIDICTLTQQLLHQTRF